MFCQEVCFFRWNKAIWRYRESESHRGWPQEKKCQREGREIGAREVSCANVLEKRGKGHQGEKGKEKKRKKCARQAAGQLSRSVLRSCRSSLLGPCRIHSIKDGETKSEKRQFSGKDQRRRSRGQEQIGITLEPKQRRRGHGKPLQYSYLENPHGRRSLAGCSPWGHKELDTTERLRTQARHTASTVSDLSLTN